MAISAPGVGSGLDVNNIIGQLVALERKPIQQIQAQIGGLQNSISAWGQIKGGLSKLQDASAKLLDDQLWRGNTATSGNEAVLGVRSDGGAVAGQYSVRVQALAQAQSIRTTTPFAANTPLGLEGRLELRQGSWSGGSFSASGSPVSVSISSSDTLGAIASKINSANAGISALVVRSGGQETLVLKSRQTGSANGFEVRAFDAADNLITDGSTGLGVLSYFNNGSGIVGQTLSAAAQDAVIDIDGVTVTSASNTLSDTIAGLTLEAKAVSASPVTVTVVTDKAAMVEAVQAFQQAFNELSKTIKDLTRADPTGQGNGPLRGDQAAIGILTMMRNYASSEVSGGGVARLSDIGLGFERDGSLSLKAAELDAALSSPEQVRALFSDASAGIARGIRNFISGALAIDGTANLRERSLKDSLTRKNQEISRIEERVSRSEQRLRAQYTLLDTKMAQYNSLSSYITQQLGAWSKSK
ncbi:MAG: flagellar filament capping protein FliD [Tepidimonas sp.]|uniref:flagellar filament capping protein FliD n=1 Tax=Tepidimonas sp. TaxID=2002775 RepID=UPI004054DC0C